MDRIELIWLVRTVGILGIVALVVGAIMPKPKLDKEERKTLCGAGFQGPITGLELSRSAEVYEMFARSKDHQEAVRRNLRLDFLFIPAYVLLYVSLAVLLAQRGAGWPFILGIAAGLLAVTAGVFDVLENLRTLHLLAAADGKLDGIWLASVIKWTAIAASSLLLAPLFLARRPPFDWIDVTFLLIGLFLILAGIGLGTFWRGRFAELSIAAMLPALVLVLPWAIRPAAFLDKLLK